MAGSVPEIMGDKLNSDIVFDFFMNSIVLSVSFYLDRSETNVLQQSAFINFIKLY